MNFLEPFYKNFLTNPFAIQFLHRHLGEGLFLLSLAFAGLCQSLKIDHNEAINLLNIVCDIKCDEILLKTGLQPPRHLTELFPHV